MHVGILAKWSLLLPNLTKSGMCGYVLVKFCIRFPENMQNCTRVNPHLHEQHMKPTGAFLFMVQEWL